MGTKQTPGEFDCYAAAEHDEPLFVLLARDPLAPLLVNLWAEVRAQLTDHHNNPGEFGKQMEANRCAASMRVWARQHGRHPAEAAPPEVARVIGALLRWHARTLSDDARPVNALEILKGR